MPTCAPSPEIIVSDVPFAPYIPGPPRSRFARQYLKLNGDPDRADRLDKCGRFYDKRDKNDHRGRVYQHCMAHFCPSCLTTRFRKLYNANESKLSTLESSGDYRTATFLEVRIPTETRSRKECVAVFQFFKQMIAEAMQPFGQDIPRWTWFAGYRGQVAVMRALIANPKSPLPDLTHSQWKSYLDASVEITVHTRCISNLTYMFRNLLLQTDLPDDPHDRAEQELLFAGMHMWCGFDLPFVPDFEEDLFASTEPLANISPDQVNFLENVLQPTKVSSHYCPKCGEPWIEKSQWFSGDAPEPRESEKRWYAEHPPD